MKIATVRMADALHKHIRRQALEENVSMNTYILQALETKTKRKSLARVIFVPPAMKKGRKRMIEDKIDKLIAAIETLTETLSKGVKAEDTKKEVPAEEPAENVTLDQLQDLCLKVVRKDRKNKEKIIKIIADQGGELLKDIDESKLPQVKAALEGI